MLNYSCIPPKEDHSFRAILGYTVRACLNSSSPNPGQLTPGRRLPEGGSDRWGVDMRTRGTLADCKSPDLNIGVDLAFTETGNMGAWEKTQLVVTV